jgi:ADP-heptose:LPS heptosyltransferase
MSKIDNPMVTIFYLAEGEGKDGAEYSSRVFKSLEEQVYKNFEIIIVHLPAFDVDTFKSEVASNVAIPLDVDVRYHVVSDPSLFLEESKSEISNDSEFVFLKTSHPMLWNAFHIAAHVENWTSRMGKRKSFQISNISIRNIVIDPNSPVGVLGYRITDPKPEDILFDEISMTKDAFLQSSWPTFLNKNADGRYTFETIKFFEHMKSKGIFRNEEITVNHLIQHQPPIDKSKIKLQQPNQQFSDSAIMFVDADGNLHEEEIDGTELVVLERFPTIVGNSQWDEEHNSKVIRNIKSYEDSNGTKFIRRIGVKRTMGMGDVILTQPFVKFLSRRYPQAEIFYYTGQNLANVSCVKMFVDCNVSEVRFYDSRAMLEDILSKEEGLDLRFDLDLAYESRPELSYASAYFTAMGYEIPEGWNLVPDMIVDHTRVAELYESKESYKSGLKFNSNDKVISFCPEGSGWGGKELPAEQWEVILRLLRDLGYKIALTTNVNSNVWVVKYKNKLSKFIDYWNEVDDVQESFKRMLEFTIESFGYIGSDNGVMHIASSFQKSLMIVSGAALLSRTNECKDVINITNSDLECIGCKHKFFFDIQQTQEGQHLTFVPPCTNVKSPHACMNFNLNYLIEKTNEFINLLETQVA